MNVYNKIIQYRGFEFYITCKCKTQKVAQEVFGISSSELKNQVMISDSKSLIDQLPKENELYARPQNGSRVGYAFSELINQIIPLAEFKDMIDSHIQVYPTYEDSIDYYNKKKNVSE